MEQHHTIEVAHRGTHSAPSMRQAGHDGSVIEVDDIAELVGIFAPEANVAVLRRALAAELESTARALIERRYLSIVLRTSSEGHMKTRLGELLGEGCQALIEDVWRCADLLGDLTGSADFGVRLAVLEQAMCPRFHVDYVGLRLVCTYVGPTTEFIATSEVDRCHLGHALDKPDDELTGLLRPEGSVRRATAGSVVLLKGEGWPGNEGRGAVHRSPAASPRTPRLVLTVDAL